jgi:type II secretory pathway pseudopilin PulG
MRRPRAFTLIEMLVAGMLAGALLTGVLSVSAALARDARRTTARAADSSAVDAAFDLIRWDLANASTTSFDRTVTFNGHGGLARDTLRPTGRLTRVAYSIRVGAGLVREQAYLDDPTRPRPWSELVLVGATEIEGLPDSSGGAVTIRIGFRDGTSVRRTLVK